MDYTTLLCISREGISLLDDSGTTLNQFFSIILTSGTTRLILEKSLYPTELSITKDNILETLQSSIHQEFWEKIKIDGKLLYNGSLVTLDELGYKNICISEYTGELPF
ncbi:hypothetical protein [Bacillus alkalicellulosilyticus]|uniref:hypothetical protein n=1 Tax=Alkalihalobacterium alkalicellulosilyticum TaxID=1912214 RepID=UPI000998D62B|nr:hypothetical protein [Bacillus alkalicellulosilyticus]